MSVVAGICSVVRSSGQLHRIARGNNILNVFIADCIDPCLVRMGNERQLYSKYVASSNRNFKGMRISSQWSNWQEMNVIWRTSPVAVLFVLVELRPLRLEDAFVYNQQTVSFIS